MNAQDEKTLIMKTLNGLRAFAEYLVTIGLESNRNKIVGIRNLTAWVASFHCVEGYDGDSDARIGKKYLEPLDELLAGKTIEKPDFHQIHMKAVIKGLDYYREELEDPTLYESVYDYDIRLCTEIVEDIKIKLAQEESQALGQTM
ncbi:hypothetical protein [Hungatella effluvii]|uniref:hypothetical protein n=1 Tax=Hungatella effluvii TaxID=1096246 RepID=UPI0022E3359C|nr:hypothetical protein [Hungatella effluvii]